MDTEARRDPLCGAEGQVLDMIFELSTPEEWAALLKAPLQRATCKGDESLAVKLVEAGAEMGSELLYKAIANGHEELFDALLKRGAPVDAEDELDETPLCIAAEDGDAAMVEFMLLHGAGKDVRSCGSEGYTALCVAARFGHLAVAEILLAAGADVNTRCGDFKLSPLHEAVRRGHEEMSRLLIDCGANVLAVDSYGMTALHVAAGTNDARTVDRLIIGGADVEAKNMNGCTPLHDAAYTTSPAAVFALLKHGAEVHVQEREGNTSLHLASAHAGRVGAPDVVDLLLRSSADERLANNGGEIAEQLLPDIPEDDIHASQNVDRVHKLLAYAAADKAWRRRGLFALCRSCPGKVRPARCCNDAECGIGIDVVHSRNSSGSDTTFAHWPCLVARVLGLEEGLFRMIVGYV